MAISRKAQQMVGYCLHTHVDDTVKGLKPLDVSSRVYADGGGLTLVWFEVSSREQGIGASHLSIAAAKRTEEIGAFRLVGTVWDVGQPLANGLELTWEERVGIERAEEWLKKLARGVQEIIAIEDTLQG